MNSLWPVYSKGLPLEPTAEYTWLIHTISFAGRRYQIARDQAQAGMRQQRLRVELRLNGELHARYQQQYLNIAECGAREAAPAPALPKPVRKDHNAGAKSTWMQGFFDRPSPPLWTAIGE